MLTLKPLEILRYVLDSFKNSDNIKFSFSNTKNIFVHLKTLQQSPKLIMITYCITFFTV